jgi:hypothetical protein
MVFKFNEFLDNYSLAFDKQDLDKITDHFTPECLFIFGKHVIACKNKEEITKVIKRQSRFIAAGKIEHKTAYSIKSLFDLDENTVVLSLVWNILNRNEQEILSTRCSYQLLKIEDTFKIVVAILPDEKDS